MKLGIMQPYFFPYLGYFDLINCTDHWIVFDTAQYIRHGWVNRNRILHPTKGWQYIIVPLQKHALRTSIEEVCISEASQWRTKIIGQLAHYQKRAPYFRQVMGLVEECLEQKENRLSMLNVKILERVCDYLDLKFSYQFFSEMKLDLPTVNAPGDWALHISQALGASEYVNPPGGENILDRQAFASAGIQLTIRDFPPMVYSCRGYEYEPNLSIIDALMWNTPEDIKAYLDNKKSA
jgi:hypothetical protein